MSNTMKTYNYYIGIDPGVNTGFAMWNKERKEFHQITTLSIHQAMDFVKKYVEIGSVFIRVEDARQRKWFGERSNQKMQGAGSIKRDCKIWDDFLTEINVEFEMVVPKKGMTKHNVDTFKRMTGYTGRTSSHARDAAMLVYAF